MPSVARFSPGTAAGRGASATRPSSRSSADVIAREGPVGLTLGAIGAMAGLSAPALAQRFGSKRGLLLAYRRSRSRHRSTGLRRSRPNRPSSSRSAGSRPRDAHPPDQDARGDREQPRLPAARSRGPGATLSRRRAEPAVPTSDLPATRSGSRARRAAAGVDLDSGALSVYVTYNGALITWAIDGRGTLRHWLRQRLDGVLTPYVTSSTTHGATTPG